MRWKINKDPEIGTTRYDMRFAWIPRFVINKDEDNAEYIIWLSWYKRIQMYEKYTALNPCGGSDRVIGWHTKERWIFNDIKWKKW